MTGTVGKKPHATGSLESVSDTSAPDTGVSDTGVSDTNTGDQATGHRGSEQITDSGSPEPAPRPVTANRLLGVAVGVGLALLVGIFGGSVMAPIVTDIFGEEEETPLEDAGNVERRSQRLAGKEPERPQPVLPPPAEREPAAAEPATADPVPGKREQERKTLAWDSPLTPSVMKLDETIRKRREARARQPSPKASARNGLVRNGLVRNGLARDGLAHDAQDNPDTGTRAYIGSEARGDSAQITHVLARGTIIPAVLKSAIDSALPGLVRAQVTRDVYDSLTGNHVLIPRGADLVGTYGRGRRLSEDRLFVSWTDIRLPAPYGTRVDLARFASLGPDGATGVEGRRSTGFLEALGATILFNLAGNATTILTSLTQKQDQRQQSELATLLGAALGNSTQNVASDHIGSLLKQRTRFRVGAGTFLNVVVEQDLSLPAMPIRGSSHQNGARANGLNSLGLNANRLRDPAGMRGRMPGTPIHDR